MVSGNDCPACGENIGIGAVFKAPLPNRIYCRHCGERLRYGETAWLIVVAVLLLCALSVMALGAAFAVGFDDVVLVCSVSLGVILVGGAALELTFVLILWYGRYRLEMVNRPKDEWSEW